MTNIIDINGLTFGKLKVLRHIKGTYWECQLERLVYNYGLSHQEAVDKLMGKQYV